MQICQNYGEVKRVAVLNELLLGKVVNDANGGDRVITHNGITIIIRFTGGKPIIVEIIGLRHPEPKDPDRPEWKGALDRLLKDGYELNRAATKDGVLIEMTACSICRIFGCCICELVIG